MLRGHQRDGFPWKGSSREASKPDQGPEAPSRMLHWVPRVCTDRYEGPKCSNTTQWKGIAAGQSVTKPWMSGVKSFQQLPSFWNDWMCVFVLALSVAWRDHGWFDFHTESCSKNRSSSKRQLVWRWGHTGNRRTHHSQCENAHQRSFFGDVPWDANSWSRLRLLKKRLKPQVSEAPIWAALAQSHSFAGHDACEECVNWKGCFLPVWRNSMQYAYNSDTVFEWTDWICIERVL